MCSHITVFSKVPWHKTDLLRWHIFQDWQTRSEQQNKKNRGTERYWDVSLRWRFAANQRWCETNRPSDAPVFICKLFSTRLFTCDLRQKFSSDLWMTMTSYMSDQTFLMVAMQSLFGDPSMVMGQFCWFSPYWVILFGSDNSIFISVGG